MKRTTAEWIKKAEADFQFAARRVRAAEPFHDQRCYLCQQSAEKYLKALLEESGQPIPRTHILRDLLALLSRHYPSLRSFTRGLRYLTRFAVGIRYPGEHASKRQTEAALRWAGRVRLACRKVLGLRTSRRRRRRPP
jgi:HEPN domain-containing protein